MSDAVSHRDHKGESRRGDTAPGEYDDEDIAAGIRGYLLGLVLASLLTLASFSVLKFGFVWGPAVPVALITFAIAQMGVHLVFFLHITTGPDNTNNVMALAFGVLIVFLLMGGSLWIMAHLNRNMTNMDPSMPMNAPMSAPMTTPMPAPTQP